VKTKNELLPVAKSDFVEKSLHCRTYPYCRLFFPSISSFLYHHV